MLRVLEKIEKQCPVVKSIPLETNRGKKHMNVVWLWVKSQNRTPSEPPNPTTKTGSLKWVVNSPTKQNGIRSKTVLTHPLPYTRHLPDVPVFALAGHLRAHVRPGHSPADQVVPLLLRVDAKLRVLGADSKQALPLFRVSSRIATQLKHEL